MIDKHFRVAGHLIRRAHQAHDAIFAQQTAGYDITSPQLAALSAIERYPGIELTPLAEMIGYDSATLGGLITRLVAKKLVSRKIGRHDRRTRQLSLTPRGEAVLKLVWPRAAGVEDRLLAALSPDERALFLDMCERVVEAAAFDSETIATGTA